MPFGVWTGCVWLSASGFSPCLLSFSFSNGEALVGFAAWLSSGKHASSRRTCGEQLEGVARA